MTCLLIADVGVRESLDDNLVSKLVKEGEEIKGSRESRVWNGNERQIYRHDLGELLRRVCAYGTNPT